MTLFSQMRKGDSYILKKSASKWQMKQLSLCPYHFPLDFMYCKQYHDYMLIHICICMYTYTYSSMYVYVCVIVFLKEMATDFHG